MDSRLLECMKNREVNQITIDLLIKQELNDVSVVKRASKDPLVIDHYIKITAGQLMRIQLAVDDCENDQITSRDFSRRSRTETPHLSSERHEKRSGHTDRGKKTPIAGPVTINCGDIISVDDAQDLKGKIDGTFVDAVMELVSETAEKTLKNAEIKIFSDPQYSLYAGNKTNTFQVYRRTDEAVKCVMKKQDLSDYKNVADDQSAEWKQTSKKEEESGMWSFVGKACAVLRSYIPQTLFSMGRYFFEAKEAAIKN